MARNPGDADWDWGHNHGILACPNVNLTATNTSSQDTGSLDISRLDTSSQDIISRAAYGHCLLGGIPELGPEEDPAPF